MKQKSLRLFLLGASFCACFPLQSAPITVTISPGSQSVTFLQENDGMCSGAAQASIGGTSCGLDGDVALSQDSPSFKVQVSARFGVFVPVAPSSLAVAIASGTLPVEIDGATGQAFFEMRVDSSFSDPFIGNTFVSATGAPLLSGPFLDGFNYVVPYQYGVPFTLSFNAITSASANSPFSSASLELEDYRLLENFPCATDGCVDVPIPLGTPEAQSVALMGVGLLLVASILRKRRPV